eukprot:CAMPEP_0170620924 /NCGR_PEP_ID=MMETSP0224-20130122/28326_1 /TAXON_ID=285029 /ORGANISM="Togula jolla, Strain CCCM 725" /LENGTH=35 /DNA_ID= /DNA_START= /DNA_END= /DNA_ORIENTATION=
MPCCLQLLEDAGGGLPDLHWALVGVHQTGELTVTM